MSQACVQTILLLFSVVQSISVHNSLGDQMPGHCDIGDSGGGAGISYKHCKHHNNHPDNAMWGLTMIWPWGQCYTITPAPAARMQWINPWCKMQLSVMQIWWMWPVTMRDNQGDADQWMASQSDTVRYTIPNQSRASVTTPHWPMIWPLIGQW